MAYIDIVGYINTQEPVKSWTTAKKQKMLERFCNTRGYTGIINSGEIDAEGNPIMVEQTKKEFVNQDIFNYIRIMCEGDAEKEAKDSVTWDKFDFNN